MGNVFNVLWGPLADETARWVATLKRSVVLVKTSDGHGSGVVWNTGGLIVTNAHVVLGREARVETEGGLRLGAQVAACDPERDLALLRIAPGDLGDVPAVPVGNSRPLRVGELVVAVGNPRGVRGAATLGIVSAPAGSDWLQADLTLAPGNSGGPLATVWGEVVGIASRIVSPGIALAVPSHVVQEFVRETAGLSVRRGVTQRAA